MNNGMKPGFFLDQVVVVTGASAGIGRSLALQLADQGAKVVLAARRVDRLELVAAECRQRGGENYEEIIILELNEFIHPVQLQRFSMQHDWDYVKKTTLWHYEDLIHKLNVLKAYPVLWQAYNHDMTKAAVFARRLFPEKNIAAGGYPAQVLSTIECLKSGGISDWGDLLSKVRTRAECAAFVTSQNLNFEEFIDVLNYLLRWAFPFQTSSRELLDHEDLQEMSFYNGLKEHKFMNSFDLLENGHTMTERRSLAGVTRLPLDFVTRITHRADIARLPYVRRKTILPLCGAGYDTLAKIAAADLAQMESDLESYFLHTQGKSWEIFQSVIVLKGLVKGARALPVIFEG